MAIGIETGKVFETWSIPIHKWKDDEWRDNTWLVDHLRQLADKIESENPSIYAVSIKTNHQYGPSIELDIFKK